MEFLNEYAVLIVVVLPVAVIVVMNGLLALTGESGTLLLPALRRLPSADWGAPREVRVEEESAALVEPEPVEEELRKAA